MRVRELIDILKDQPLDAEVELSIVAPVSEDEDDITVDRYSVEGVLAWNDEEGAPAGDDDDDEKVIVWLIGGDDEDVDAFLDAVDPEEDEVVGTHSHDGHDHKH